MTKPSFVSLALVTSALIALPTAAMAEGKTDLARKAIAAAQAKIEASNIVGAAGDAPRLHAQAVSILHQAQDELDHHEKDAAIQDANHASEVADMALAASQRSRTQEQDAVTQAAVDSAAQANARAADAQATAAAAQAEAAAARAAPPVVVAPPAAPAQTTVTTTSTDRTAATTTSLPTHRVVRKRVIHPTTNSSQTTTTTVSTGS